MFVPICSSLQCRASRIVRPPASRPNQRAAKPRRMCPLENNNTLPEVDWFKELRRRSRKRLPGIGQRFRRTCLRVANCHNARGRVVASPKGPRALCELQGYVSARATLVVRSIPLGVLNSSKIRKTPSWSPLNQAFSPERSSRRSGRLRAAWRQVLKPICCSSAPCRPALRVFWLCRFHRDPKPRSRNDLQQRVSQDSATGLP